MKAYKPPKAHGWHDALADLARALELWDVGRDEWDAAPNVPLSRVNSMTLSQAERTVTVRFWKDGREVVLSMGDYDSASQNLKVIALCVDDMRMIERRGLSQTMQSAYMQLGAPAAGRDPWEVLGLRPGASVEAIQAMYRTRARELHPDNGGSTEAMAELNVARDALLERINAA